VAVHALRFWRQRAAHHVPHDELHRLCAGLLHELLVRHLGELFRVVFKLIQKHPVERFVHVTEALALELMRHPARAHDEDL
jgi:hypothetical protein